MKRIHLGGYLLLVVLLFGNTGSAYGSSYFGYYDFGGSWYDAEKTLANTEDDLMCWAATTSNMLAYTGWGFPVGASFSNEDNIFAYFQNHWTDVGGNMYFGTNWWFDGINDSQRWSGWSQVDVPGGGFYTDYNFSDYYTWSSNGSTALSLIDTYLHQGRGVGLTVLGPGAHAITAWGYEYDAFGNYDPIMMLVTTLPMAIGFCMIFTVRTPGIFPKFTDLPRGLGIQFPYHQPCSSLALVLSVWSDLEGRNS
jgi:hypothetical protein